MILELMQHAATAAIVVGLIVGLPILKRANGHSLFIRGVMIVLVSAGVARLGSELGNGYIQAAGSLGISLTCLGLVLSPLFRWPR